jgi:hypothetical protein
MLNDPASPLWTLRNEDGEFVECLARLIPAGVEIEIVVDSSRLCSRTFESGEEALKWAEEERRTREEPDGERRGAGGDAAALEAIQRELARAWVHGDRTAIERILGTEWTVTTPSGRVVSRQTVLADAIEAPRNVIKRISVDDLRVRLLGEAAVVTGTSRAEGTVDGVPYEARARFTDVFVKRDGRVAGGRVTRERDRVARRGSALTEGRSVFPRI